MKQMKKFLSMVLALAMVLAMTSTAFAAIGGSSSNTGSGSGTSSGSTTTPAVAGEITDISKPVEVEVTGTTQQPTIKIKMSNAAAVVLNPYCLTVETKPAEGETPAVTSDAQVVSATQWVENLSNVPLNAKIGITGTKGGDLAFAADSDMTDDALKADLTTKTVLMYFEAKTAAATTSEPAWEDDYKAAKAAAVEAAKVTSPEYGAKIVGATKAEIAKVTMAAKADDAKCNMAYHFAGEAVKNPTTDWAKTDTVNVSLAFTFSVGAIGASEDAGEEEDTTPGVTISVDSGDAKADSTLTLKATPANITATGYEWEVVTDTDSIIDSFTDGGAATQDFDIAAGVAANKTATVKVTVSYQDGEDTKTVSDTYTITTVAAD